MVLHDMNDILYLRSQEYMSAVESTDVDLDFA